MWEVNRPGEVNKFAYRRGQPQLEMDEDRVLKTMAMNLTYLG